MGDKQVKAHFQILEAIKLLLKASTHSDKKKRVTYIETALDFVMDALEVEKRK